MHFLMQVWMVVFPLWSNYRLCPHCCPLLSTPDLASKKLAGGELIIVKPHLAPLSLISVLTPHSSQCQTSGQKIIRFNRFMSNLVITDHWVILTELIVFPSLSPNIVVKCQCGDAHAKFPVTWAGLEVGCSDNHYSWHHLDGSPIIVLNNQYCQASFT